MKISRRISIYKIKISIFSLLRTAHKSSVRQIENFILNLGKVVTDSHMYDHLKSILYVGICVPIHPSVIYRESRFSKKICMHLFKYEMQRISESQVFKCVIFRNLYFMWKIITWMFIYELQKIPHFLLENLQADLQIWNTLNSIHCYGNSVTTFSVFNTLASQFHLRKFVIMFSYVLCR